MNERTPFKFVHDNSSIRKSNVVQDWLKSHGEIQMIHWPTGGCDMNPVENLWAIMTRDWSVGEVRNVQAAEMRAREVWECEFVTV